MRNLIVTIAFMAVAAPAVAQTLPTKDTVLDRMWTEGMTESSQAYRLAQTLLDSIGPRLTGTPAHHGAMDWLIRQYAGWGIAARKEQYGTWTGWRQGNLHVDMIEPRVRTLEAHLLAWSPGTNGVVQGEVVMPPEDLTDAAATAWLATVEG